jgi:phage tail tape measure protein, TP901 family|nr:MAG TPA: tail tape measure protein [Caudoviricetes sp.]DAS26236.1 MAG TPA: tail tape measure protein [Caudoviricetes sp.]
MGKTLREEDLRLNIIVNGDPARREMGELDRQTKELARSNKELRAEQRRLKSEGKENTALYKQNAAEIKKNNAAIKANQDRIKQLRSEMKLTSLTTAELSQRHAELRNAMRNVVPGTPQWRQLRNELQAVTARMAQLRTDTAATEGVMCRMATNVNKYIGTVTATFAAAAMYGSGLYKAIQAYSGLDEAMSNARKTTGMTRREVEELSEKLARIDTRTPQNELLSLARIGGKLGIAKNDIEGFTRAADVIKISLGKDLGDDVETTIGQIGKLVNVFQINKEFGIEQGMMKAAAAVNELGKSSTANEANIVEFMRRVGGVGYSAKISLANIAGLGATLDDLGVTMEVAGTSMSQVITGMFRRTDAFAAAAKMSVKDFRKLMDEDMNEAIIRFAEGMGSDGGAMAKIVEALDGLHLNGQRATGVLTALAQNTAKVREQQQIANKAFDEGTSCLSEFNIMNNTVEATTEKLKKRITEEAAELGKSLIPAYHDSLSVQASLIETARILIEWLIKNRGAVLGLVAAFAAYRTWIFTIDKVSKVYHATIALGRGLKLSYLMAVRATTAATVAETGATKAATIATRLFGAALKSLPLGWVAAAVGVVVGAITYFTTRTKSATDAQKTFNEITKAAADIEDEHGVNLVGRAEKISQLMRVVNDEATSEERRIAAITELQELMPASIDLITQETIANGEAAKSVKAYTDQLILQATIKAALQKKQELIDQAAKDRMTGDDSRVGWFKRAFLYATTAEGGGTLDYDTVLGQVREENRKKYQSNLDKQLADIDRILAEAEEKLEAKKLIVPDPDKNDADKLREQENREHQHVVAAEKDKTKWSLDSDAAFLNEKQKLRKKFAEGEISAEQEYQDELLALEITALKARLAANKESGADRSKLEIQLADKLIEQKKREQQQADAAENLRIQNMTDATERENADYERRKKQYAGNAAALEQLAVQHQRKLKTIQLDKVSAAIKAEEDAYKRERQNLRNQQSAEMLSFTGTAEERKRLKKRHNEELLELGEQYARDMTAKLTELLENGNFEGFSLDTALLTEEEKTKLLQMITELQEKLVSLGVEKEKIKKDDWSPVKASDFLGFSQEDWETLFTNLEQGKIGVQEVAMAMKAMIEIYAMYDQFATAAENRSLKQFKKNNDAKKKELERRLQQGSISQEQYNIRVEQMDAEYAAKEEELQIKQAQRHKAMSIVEAIINTAVGATAAYGMGGIIGPILAAMITALGAAQVALIASQPIGGAEEGGMFVTRAQDGRKFNARVNPDARGYIDRPTVLVGENGMEYVIPNEAMQNPTARPIINMIEAVRQKGRLRDFDFAQIMPAMFRFQGYAAGGPIAGSMPTDNTSLPVSGLYDSADIKKILEYLEYLCNKADEPIPAIVTLMGTGGFFEAIKKYMKLKKLGEL